MEIKKQIIFKKICKIILILIILMTPFINGCKKNDFNWRECYAINIITSNTEKTFNDFYREYNNKYDNYIVEDNNYEKVYVKIVNGYIKVKCITFTGKIFENEYLINNCIYQIRWK